MPQCCYSESDAVNHSERKDAYRQCPVTGPTPSIVGHGSISHDNENRFSSKSDGVKTVHIQYTWQTGSRGCGLKWLFGQLLIPNLIDLLTDPSEM